MGRMFALFERVMLVHDLPDGQLKAGSVGAVVDVYSHPAEAYEVEFLDGHGQTIALLPLEPSSLRRIEE
jgi:Domain of unknown function (DUF4926)